MINRKKYSLSVGNLNCIFISKDKTYPLLRFWTQFVSNVFQEDSTSKGRSGSYVLKDIDILDIDSDETVIIGRLYRKTKLRIEQKLDDFNRVVKVGKTEDSAPSSVFTYLLSNHLLLFTVENPGGPTESSFATFIRKRVNEELKAYKKLLLKRLKKKSFGKKIIENFPKIDATYLPISSQASLDALFEKVIEIEKINITQFSQNGILDSDDLFPGNDELLKELSSPKLDTSIKSPKNIEASKKFVGKILKAANSRYKVRGRDAKNALVSIDNEGTAYRTDLKESASEKDASEIAKIQYEQYKSSVAQGEIPKIGKRNTPKDISKVKKSKRKGG